jgi:Kef-type K+ transport system membrane component KefB
MKGINKIFLYLAMLGAFAAVMYLVILGGQGLEPANITSKVPEGSSWEQFSKTIHHSITHPLAILLLQIITIIAVARLFGFFCKKIGQPSVVGEIVAGIFLGPSFIGHYFPEVAGFLFPAQSLGNLQFLSQIGLILFMFVIGMELDLNVLKTKANDAIVISHASIMFPFALGVGLAYFIYEQFSPEGINFLSFALFTGIAMSITAFPVLARIVQERGLTKTRLGMIVITCAAADDITAWCILATVIAIVKAGAAGSAIFTIILALGYVFIMLRVVQPFLKKVGDIYSNKEGLSKPIVAIFIMTLIVSAYVAEIIGIHALFGAFMAGVIMPANINFRSIFIEKVEDVSVVLLLPLFFVFTGLRTQIGLLNDPQMWGICLLIIGVAVFGKFVGSAVAARLVGQNLRTSLMIGALMNTRGLMELVVLNIGYDLGVLTPEVFAMMVIMALVTTFMTGPAMDLIGKIWPEPATPIVPAPIENAGKYNILVSFGRPETGRSLLRLANAFVKKAPQSSAVTALHLSPSNDLNQYNIEEYERDSFTPLKSEAQKLDMSVVTLFKPSQDVDTEVIETANMGNFDLLVVGAGHSVFEGTLLGKILGFTTKVVNPGKLIGTLTGKENFFDADIFGDRTQQILKDAEVPVGILIDKGLTKADNVVIPVFSPGDAFLLNYAQKLIHNNESRVIVFDTLGIVKQHAELKETIRAIEHVAPNHLALYTGKPMEKEFLQQQDLVVLSLDSWNKAIDQQSPWLAYIPSALVVKP